MNYLDPFNYLSRSTARCGVVPTLVRFAKKMDCIGTRACPSSALLRAASRVNPNLRCQARQWRRRDRAQPSCIHSNGNRF